MRAVRLVVEGSALQAWIWLPFVFNCLWKIVPRHPMEMESWNFESRDTFNSTPAESGCIPAAVAWSIQIEVPRQLAILESPLTDLHDIFRFGNLTQKAIGWRSSVWRRRRSSFHRLAARGRPLMN